MTVQRLSSDYTAPWVNHTAQPVSPGGPNGTSAIFSTDTSAGAPNFAESPSIFKWKGYYYVMSTHVCCFCRTGGGVSVFTAAHPLGPWSSTAVDIGCDGHTNATQRFNPETCRSSVGFMTNNSAFPGKGAWQIHPSRYVML
jgi:beta-xylosidase